MTKKRDYADAFPRPLRVAESTLDHLFGPQEIIGDSIRYTCVDCGRVAVLESNSQWLGTGALLHRCTGEDNAVDRRSALAARQLMEMRMTDE